MLGSVGKFFAALRKSISDTPSALPDSPPPPPLLNTFCRIPIPRPIRWVTLTVNTGIVRLPVLEWEFSYGAFLGRFLLSLFRKDARPSKSTGTFTRTLDATACISSWTLWGVDCATMPWSSKPISSFSQNENVCVPLI
jgi:hypothetical protein